MKMIRLNVTHSFDGFAMYGCHLADLPYYDPIDISELPPLSDMKDKQIFHFIGIEYPVGNPFTEEYFDATADYLRSGGANVSNKYIHDFRHTMPSNLPHNEQYHPEASCALPVYEITPPHKSGLMNCGYNAAYYGLNAMNPKRYSALNDQSFNHSDYGQFHAFNQTPYTTPDSKMDEIGYIYIPDACRDGKTFCESMMWLHACYGGAGVWGDTEARRTGLLEMAATNNIIVVFPQNNDSATFYYGDGEYNFTDIKYCWSSVETKDPNHPQFLSLLNIQSALVLNGHNWEHDKYTSTT